MVDMNIAVNPDAKIKTFVAKTILAQEIEKKVNIRNNKNIPTTVPERKGDQANCLDLSIVKPNLKTYVNKENNES